jgi:hypothetical protein
MDGMINQDLPHQMSRDANKVSAISPLDVLLIDQP